MSSFSLRSVVRPLGAFACVVFLSSCVSTERVVSPQQGMRPGDIAANKDGTGVVISQIYGGGGNSGATYKNDFIELYNPGTVDVPLSGWSVQYASAAGTTWQVTSLSGTIPAGKYYLIQEAVGAGGTTDLPKADATGAIPMSATAGKVALLNTTTALNATTGCFTANVVDFVGYGSGVSCFEGTAATPAPSNTNAILRRNGGVTDTDDNRADFATGAPTPRNSGNPGGGGPPPPSSGNVTISGRGPDLPVGFQTQLFVNDGSVDGSGSAVNNNNVVWSSSNSSIIDVNPATGVITAKAAGNATITAAAKSDGSAGSTRIFASVAPISTGARTGHNVELGTPADGDPSDEIIVSRRQYTLSYNASRGTPNWVSWNLDASHIGSSGRCNCFTADPAVSPSYDTNDWINGGIWSRGHVAPSGDWTDATGDNAPTFYLSNMVPQNQTANTGAWGDFENYLRTLATGSTEIYIVAGPIYTPGRTNGEAGLGRMAGSGRIAIPDSIWKVAVIVPDARSANEITSPSDVRVIAINTPNSTDGAGHWDDPQFQTTIDAIQRSTGFDLLSTLPEAIQCQLEVRNCLPQPAISPASGSATATAGVSYVVQTSATDQDGADGPWRYVLEWGDGTSFTATLASLPTASRPLARAKTYAAPGTYTIRLTITDRKGGRGVQTFTVTVN